MAQGARAASEASADLAAQAVWAVLEALAESAVQASDLAEAGSVSMPHSVPLGRSET